MASGVHLIEGDGRLFGQLMDMLAPEGAPLDAAAVERMPSWHRLLKVIVGERKQIALPTLCHGALKIGEARLP